MERPNGALPLKVSYSLDDFVSQFLDSRKIGLDCVASELPLLNSHFDLNLALRLGSQDHASELRHLYVLADKGEVDRLQLEEAHSELSKKRPHYRDALVMLSLKRELARILLLAATWPDATGVNEYEKLAGEKAEVFQAGSRLFQSTYQTSWEDTIGSVESLLSN